MHPYALAVRLEQVCAAVAAAAAVEELIQNVTPPWLVLARTMT